MKLWCGVCDCILGEKFKYQELVTCAYCGRQWTLSELLLELYNNNWTQKTMFLRGQNGKIN